MIDRRDHTSWNLKRSLVAVLVVGATHLLVRLAMLAFRWSDVQDTWLNPGYRVLYRSPAIEIGDFLFRPLLVWILLAAALLVVDAILRRARHVA